MAGDDRKTPAGRGGLTRQAVIEAALALADAEGLEAVTIRRLARALGVTPMALYWHVRNKDELLDGVAASLVERVDVSLDASASWQDQLRAVLTSLLAVLRAHPAAAPLVSIRTVSTEGSLQVTEVVLDILRRAGYSPVEATQVARHALSTLTSLVSAEPGVVAGREPAGQEEARHRAWEALASLSPERYPRLVEAAAPLSAAEDREAYFAFGLDLLLAGIEAMAARHRPA